MFKLPVGVEFRIIKVASHGASGNGHRECQTSDYGKTAFEQAIEQDRAQEREDNEVTINMLQQMGMDPRRDDDSSSVVCFVFAVCFQFGHRRNVGWRADQSSEMRVVREL